MGSEAAFTIAKRVKQIKCLSTNEWLKKKKSDWAW
jgi:hypothetical protein